jgi:hypothetical protein
MRPRRALALITASLTVLIGAQSAHAAFFPAQAIDGPSADIQQFHELDLAPDGTGAAVYTKTVGGKSRVFATTLAGGVWTTPVQVDTPLTCDCTDPKVAVANGGRAAIVFRDAGNEQIVGVVRPSANQSFGSPSTVLDPPAGNVSQPRIDMNAAGVGYVAFIHFNGGGDARLVRLEGTQWTLNPTALDANPAADAGASSNGPNLSIAVGSDGQAVALFNEELGGSTLAHARRVSGATLGPAVQWNVPSFQGRDAVGGLSSGVMLDVAIADDGTAWAVGRQDFDDDPGAGEVQRARAIGRKLVGNAFGDAVAVDGVAFPFAAGAAGGIGGENPEIALGGNGLGLVGVNAQLVNDARAGRLSAGGGSATAVLNPNEPNKAGAPAIAASDDGTGVAAFGRAGVNDVVARRFDGSAFGASTILSNPGFGQAGGFGSGNHAATSELGDFAIGFLQGAAATTRIVIAEYDAPPTAPVGMTRERVTRDATPTLRWTAASDLWGGVQSYHVIVDGKQVGTTTGLSFTTPKLSSSAHSWSVQAVDRRGQATASATRKLPIDVRKPKAALRFKGVKRVGKKVKVIVIARDASGIKRITVKFGDRKQKVKTRRIKRKSTFAHRYKKAKRFTVRATVIDKAGNRRTVTRKLRIKP